MVLVFPIILFSQNVAINETRGTANDSDSLDIYFDDKVILIPRI